MIDLSSFSWSGELAALTAAILWAGATVLFSRIGKQIKPLELNLIKGVIAGLLIVLTLIFSRTLLTALEPRALFLLITSGIIGIGFGDTVYFAALQALGARLTLLLSVLAPPMAGLMALVFLGESLSVLAWTGISVTVLGVAWVITERAPTGEGHPANYGKGIVLGLLAAAAQAAGIVLSRAALTQTEVSPLWSALLRLSGGVCILMLWLFFTRAQRSFKTTALDLRKSFRIIFFATFIGTYLAIWLQQVSLDYTSAGIAQTLLSTSPLFVLPIAAFMGEKISIRALLGVVIAMIGISLLFLI